MSSQMMIPDLNSNYKTEDCPPNRSLPLHTASEAGGGPFKCDSCSCQFNHDYELWLHWRDHIPREERHLCHLCPFVANNSMTLQCHFSNSHQTVMGSVACNICRGAFLAKDRADLSRHVFRSHMFDKRFHLRSDQSSTSWRLTALF